MNILYLCDEYPPGRHGGIGTSVSLMARAMIKLGHNVVVAGLYPLGYGGEDEFDDEGVNVFRFRLGLDADWFSNPGSLAVRTIRRILKDTGLLQRDIKKSLAYYQQQLEKLIADYHIDIVEMPDYNDYMRFCRSYVPFPQLSLPVIVKMNGSITYFTKEANKPLPKHIFKMEQHVLNQATAVIAASMYTAAKSCQYFSYPKNVDVLYNGISTNIANLNHSKNAKQVVFTGSLVQKKGIFQLAKAWNMVNQQMPDARLLILGKGSQQKVIANLTDAKLTVSFMGHVDSQTLYHYLSTSQISVFPSYSEAFALAPLEAMACGTAVINTNRTSGPELIDDQINGLLIDPDNIDGLAAAILYLLNNPDVCATLAKNGNEMVRERFEIGKIALQHIDFYNKILTGTI